MACLFEHEHSGFGCHDCRGNGKNCPDCCSSVTPPPKSASEALLKEARRKYLQLGVELEESPATASRSMMLHTHAKLGIFLEEILSPSWRT